MKTIVLNLEGDIFEFVHFSEERMKIATNYPNLKLISRGLVNKHRGNILASMPFGSRIKINSDGVLKIGPNKIIGYKLLPQSSP